MTKKTRAGFALVVTLMVLALVSIIILWVGSLGIVNLNQQQIYRMEISDQYAAIAAANDALYQVGQNTSYGPSSEQEISLNNNLNSYYTFGTTCTYNTNCASYKSGNNITGTTATTDGMGYSIPPGFVKANGYYENSVTGKTSVYSILATPIPCAANANSRVTAGTVTGCIRNNDSQDSGNGQSISVNTISTGDLITTNANSNTVTCTVPGCTVILNASTLQIPDIGVGTIIGKQSGSQQHFLGSNGSKCFMEWLTGVPASTAKLLYGCTYSSANPVPGTNVIDATYSTCSCATVYVEGDIPPTGFTLTTLTLDNGVQLFIDQCPATTCGTLQEGNFSMSSSTSTLVASGALAYPNTIMTNGTFTSPGTTTAATGSNGGSLSIIVGGAGNTGTSASFGQSTLTTTTVTGFVYAQSGNIVDNSTVGSTWTGTVATCGAGTSSPAVCGSSQTDGRITLPSGGTLTFDPQYITRQLGLPPSPLPNLSLFSGTTWPLVTTDAWFQQ